MDKFGNDLIATGGRLLILSPLIVVRSTVSLVSLELLTSLHHHFNPRFCLPVSSWSVCLTNNREAMHNNALKKTMGKT